MTLRTGLTILAVVFVAILVIGFIRDPFGLRRGAEHRAEVKAVETQETVTTQTAQASDRTSRDVRVIIEKGQKEIEYVQTLPGADTPLDPVRRAGLCGSLGRVFDGPVCTSDPVDGEPAGAMPDAP